MLFTFPIVFHTIILVRISNERYLKCYLFSYHNNYGAYNKRFNQIIQARCDVNTLYGARCNSCKAYSFVTTTKIRLYTCKIIYLKLMN